MCGIAVNNNNQEKGIGLSFMLEAEHIQKHYGKKMILKDISLHAHPGECIGILGANGCGKSTLLSILAGVNRANHGSIRIDGQDTKSNPHIRTRYMGYVPQENPLIPELSAKDNLSLWYCDSALDMKEELDHGTLADLGIPKFLNVPVSRMSGGMKKRLSIGCAIANNPAILIMDEPSAALDLVCKESIRSYMKRHIQNNGILLLTTHEEAELALCTKIYIIKDGQLIEKQSGLSTSELVACF